MVPDSAGKDRLAVGATFDHSQDRLPGFEMIVGITMSFEPLTFFSLIPSEYDSRRIVDLIEAATCHHRALLGRTVQVVRIAEGDCGHRVEAMHLLVI